LSWETVNVNEIAPSKPTEFSVLPEGNHVFRLVGAKMDKYQTSSIALDLAVDEGAGKGRRIFPTLPAPKDNNDWPAQALAKLFGALGIEQQAGETVLDALNRASSNGHSRFTADTTVREYTKKDGSTGQDVKLQYFSVAPIAGV